MPSGMITKQGVTDGSIENGRGGESLSTTEKKGVILRQLQQTLRNKL